MKPKPIQMWAVVEPYKRSRRIVWWTVSGSRADAIAAWREDTAWNEDLPWREWQAKGYTCERVTVAVKR